MIDARWVALSLTGRIGNKTLQALLQYFNHDTAAILEADAKTLQQVQGVGPKIAQSIGAIDLEAVEQSITRWQKMGVRIWTIHDTIYPETLKKLDDAPPTLFVRGDHEVRFDQCVAIVGTRSPSTETRTFAQNLSSALAERGYLIVSGLALGIDSAAHMGALAYPAGKTVGVLGSGVLNIYPPNHDNLAKAVMLRGVVLSEINPTGTTSPSNLVARNRIISGLSQAVIVVETSVDGGAMHAARFASQQGRPIYTLDCGTSGNQALLAAGAMPLPMDLANLPF